MDALWEWIEFVGTLAWLPHGCSVGMDEVSSGRYHGWDMDALPEWMEFVERYHGCHMDALREWMQFVGTLS